MAENPLKIICPGCHQVNFIRFGLILPCVACKRHLQHIRCPHCEFENVWSRNFPGEEGQLVECSSCREQFRFFNCSKCEKTTFWTPFQRTNLVKKVCPQCHKIDRFDSLWFLFEFSHRSVGLERWKTVQLNVIRVLIKIQFFVVLIVQQSKRINIRTKINFERLNCRTCQNAFAFLRCFHCLKTNLWPNVNVDVANFQCFSCGKDLKKTPVESGYEIRFCDVERLDRPVAKDVQIRHDLFVLTFPNV